jgi:hypothetical protein
MHVTLQFMNRGRFRPADDVQGHGLVGVAAKAADLEIEIPAFKASPRVGEG